MARRKKVSTAIPPIDIEEGQPHVLLSCIRKTFNASITKYVGPENFSLNINIGCTLLKFTFKCT